MGENNADPPGYLTWNPSFQQLYKQFQCGCGHKPCMHVDSVPLMQLEDNVIRMCDAIKQLQLRHEELTKKHEQTEAELKELEKKYQLHSGSFHKSLHNMMLMTYTMLMRQL